MGACMCMCMRFTGDEELVRALDSHFWGGLGWDMSGVWSFDVELPLGLLDAASPVLIRRGRLRGNEAKCRECNIGEVVK